MNTLQEIPLLSPREVEILRHVAEGKTTKTIADALSIECRTIERHRLSIRRQACLFKGGKTALFQFARRYFRRTDSPSDNDNKNRGGKWQKISYLNLILTGPSIGLIQVST